MAKLHIHPIGLVLIFFGILAWMVALGGLAATTNYCLKDNDASYCSRTYQMEWWSIWFEFFLLAVMLVTCFLTAFDRARFIFLTYLSLVTSLLTITSRNFINATVQSFVANGNTITIRDTKQSANNASAAGAIMLCVTNYALIIFIGLAASASQQASLAMQQPEQKYAPSNF